MKLFQRENIPIRGLNFLLLLIICFVFFFTRSCNKDYDLLSGKNTKIGVATIYDHTDGKGRKYLYIYKAYNKHYYGSVSSHFSKRYIDKNTLLQSFYVIYRNDDPSHNILIYQRPLPLTFNLDTPITQKIDLRKFIKWNTLDAGDGNYADMQDFEEWSTYQKHVKKWKS